MELIALTAILGYTGAFYLLSSKLMTAEGPNRSRVSLIAAVALLCHGTALINAIMIEGGQNFSLTNTLSLLIWIMALAITVKLPKLKVLVVAPSVYFAAILSVAGLWLVPPQYLTNFEMEPMVLVHVILALIAYAVMLLVTLYAIQLAGIDRRLKQRQLILSPALPPLMTVEKQLYMLIWIGFALLSVGLATGWLFLDNFFGGGQGHKATLSIIAWGLYAGLLIRHHTNGVQIRTTVAVSFIGAGLLSLAYFGARVVKELFLT